MERNGEKPNYEPLIQGAPWRLLDAKIPLLETPFNPDDPTTYKRAAYNPETQEHWFLRDSEIAQLRRFIDPTMGPDHVNQAIEDTSFGRQRRINQAIEDTHFERNKY